MKTWSTVVSAAAVVAVVSFSGCMKSHRVMDVEYSGFLEDYERLEPGGRNEAAFRWERAGVDWTRYDKCIVDPVQVWRDSKGTRDLTDKQAQEMANYLYKAAYRALDDYLTMVERPQPRTVRLQIAITRVGARDPVMDTVSTVTPIGIAASSMTQAFTGRAPFTGDAAVEFRVVDAETGRVLSEGIDRRAGGKWFGKDFNQWADAYAAMDAWGEMIGYRTCVRLKRSDCRAPANM